MTLPCLMLSQNSFQGDDVDVDTLAEGLDEWDDEFRSLRRDFNVGRAGFDIVAFRQLIDDDSEIGSPCSDAELRSLVDRLRPQRTLLRKGRRGS